MDFSSRGFRVHVADSISQVAAQWDDQHLHTGPLLSPYLAALESAIPSDMEFRYVLIKKDGKVAASAYLQLVNFSDKNFSEHGPAWLLKAMKLFFRLKKVRLLFCGNLFCVDYPCLKYNPELIRFEQALEIILQIRQVEKCQLLMMKEMNGEKFPVHVLTSNGFKKYDEDLTMALRLKDSWQNFDDYAQSLTKKYRKRLRMIRQAQEKIIRRNLSDSEISSFLPEIDRLFDQTASRQFLKMGLIDAQYFTAMKAAFGGNFFITGYFLEDKLLAFASHIDHTDTLELHYIGIDYLHNETYSLYFNILYNGVDQAIAMKKKNLELGRTAREAKASVGCDPVPSNDYLFASGRFVNFLIGIFENLFLAKMGSEWKNRQPFKKPTAASS